ncbi:hypothetical protein OKW32_008030 [Paraburkholderia youngii]
MLNYEVVKNWPIEDVTQTYSERDVMLYSLGLGLGADPLDTEQLRYVYEKDLQAMPTCAAAFAWPKSWMRDPRTGIDYLKLVHGEQDVRFVRPMPVAATIVSKTRVSRISDKGAGKGAIVELKRDIIDASTGEQLAEVRQVSFLRGDGGFSAESGASERAARSASGGAGACARCGIRVPDRCPCCVDLPPFGRCQPAACGPGGSVEGGLQPSHSSRPRDLRYGGLRSDSHLRGQRRIALEATRVAPDFAGVPRRRSALPVLAGQ